MLELFAVGTFWFWALIAAELVLLFVFAEYENGICATISLVAFLAALQFCGNVNLFGALLTNWYYLIPLLGFYIVAAIVFAIFMWTRYTNFKLAEHDEILAKFILEMGLPASTKILPIQHRAEWVKRVERTKDSKTGLTIADTPLAKLNKARIVRWMSLWPIYGALFLGKDLVVEFFSWIYKGLSGFLQRISDNIYAKANVKANLELPPQQPQDN